MAFVMLPAVLREVVSVDGRVGAQVTSIRHWQIYNNREKFTSETSVLSRLGETTRGGIGPVDITLDTKKLEFPLGYSRSSWCVWTVSKIKTMSD